MQDLRRLAWDLSLFTTTEFSFVRLPPQYITGSSIMPNKSNPDVVELLRARTASIECALVEIQSILSLTSGYHRDRATGRS
jgi:argininosuccinate lyase